MMSVTAGAQALKSPREFLGYEPGERFTPHERILGYFRDCAQAAPGQVRLEKYGQTNEGRDLLVAMVSSPENMQQLESIRKNSLRLAGLQTDRAGDVNMPAIVWLSYNVHGNEASSSEVSMVLLYELLSLKNTSMAGWLRNTVVIIDPCLNPDGRERYIQWYNQVTGRNSNADPFSREHEEPWPGGRINHYYFDLNRDWAWQTQVESRQRVRLYQQWMPAIHGDYHEQYPENPYYFAPAAEPFHDAITPWQRSFQHTIGRNHAKYFDAKGWLYFTREYFDLFYPSYGDTYPIFNGSVGMTFEQAGHGVAGRAIAVSGGDTLKLSDRIEHHLTTSLSTIEVASLNAVRINQEFRKYFEDSRSQGSGAYKTYLVCGQNARQLADLQELLDRNQISWKHAKAGVATKGYDYFTGKEEVYTTQAADILVSTLQPQANLARVLFEPFSRLTDSVTYDITAWALPYVYGIRTYAIKDKLPEAPATIAEARRPVEKSAYGYLVEYSAFSDGRLLAGLLKQGIRLRFTEKDIIYQGKTYQRGTLIMLNRDNQSKMDAWFNLVQNSQASIVPLSTGFMDAGFDIGSDKIHQLKAPVVAVLSGEESIPESLGEVWQLFDQQLDYPVSLINSQSLASVNLSKYDVLIVPEGNYKFLSDKDLSATVKNWVRQGGKIIAIGQAVTAMASNDWGVKIKKQDQEKADEKAPDYKDVKKYGNRERDMVTDFIPGAIYRVALDNTHPLCFGYPEYYFLLKQNGQLLEFMKDGWNAGVIKKDNQVAGFVGSSVKSRLIDGTVFGVLPMGRGSIVLFTDNPLFRSFWQNGKLLFLNAVYLAGQ